jgi:hypothetical protein
MPVAQAIEQECIAAAPSDGELRLEGWAMQECRHAFAFSPPVSREV